MTKRYLASAGALALAGLASACAGPNMPSYPLPEDPGLYAIMSDDELLRLDGDRDWEVESWPERSALGRYTEFVIFEPGLSRTTQGEDSLVDIQRVVWLRSEIDASGYAGPVEGNEWVVTRLDQFNEPVTAEFVQGWPGYVHIVPQQPLSLGLYSLRFDGGAGTRVARFGVDWQAVDKRLYAARNCVDRYAAAEPGYRTCTGGGDLKQEAAAEGLEVFLVDPLRLASNLVVQGVVTNTTDRPKRLPGMQAVLLDNSGRKLTQAKIEPSKAELAAGERLRFKTEIVNAPQETARIDVEFLPTSNAGM
jgi:hypothetical protein